MNLSYILLKINISFKLLKNSCNILRSQNININKSINKTKMLFNLFECI